MKLKETIIVTDFCEDYRTCFWRCIYLGGDLLQLQIVLYKGGTMTFRLLLWQRISPYRLSFRLIGKITWFAHFSTGRVVILRAFVVTERVCSSLVLRAQFHTLYYVGNACSKSWPFYQLI